MLTSGPWQSMARESQALISRVTNGFSILKRGSSSQPGRSVKHTPLFALPYRMYVYFSDIHANLQNPVRSLLKKTSLNIAKYLRRSWKLVGLPIFQDPSYLKRSTACFCFGERLEAVWSTKQTMAFEMASMLYD